MGPDPNTGLGTTALAGFDASILAFIDDLRRCGEIAESQFPKYRYAARHFLIWLELTGIALKTVDATSTAFCGTIAVAPHRPHLSGPAAGASASRRPNS